MRILDENLKFIIPNRIMRELLTLLHIDENSRISQHKLSKLIGVSSSMANTYIKDMSEAGWITVSGETNRTKKYFLTDLGKQKKNVFLHRFSRDIARMYSLAKKEFEKMLIEFYREGLTRVVFFGAADAGELVFNASLNLPIKILAIVDNDTGKHGKKFGELVVTSPKDIESYHPDGIIITTFGRVEEIYAELDPLRRRGIKIRNI
jgi:DNA-binding MarR family transcriptional regulator